MWGGGEWGGGGGESPNDERQTSFLFPFLPLLVKRPILSVGWNLSDFSPRFSPSGACRMSLSSPLPLVSGFLLWCSCCVGVGGVVTPGEVSLVWRSRLALVLDVKVGARKKRRLPLSSLIQCRVMNRPCHPPLQPLLLAPRSRSAVIQL